MLHNQIILARYSKFNDLRESDLGGQRRPDFVQIKKCSIGDDPGEFAT